MEQLMAVRDQSTRKLKRTYFRALKAAWRYAPYRLEGFYRDIGLSADYWDAYSTVCDARTELKSRGVFVP